MDARQYDRIADLLAQIYSKYNNMEIEGALGGTYVKNFVPSMRNEMQEILERALVINNFMGELKEKGMI
tara:strand:- start:237 stop:443 length:207 start_codon:yes stop_codon:yes gene_type:complete